MKTKIFGKKIVNKYEVVDHLKEIKDENGKSKTVFDAKPFIHVCSEVEDWKTIVPDINGEIKYNGGSSPVNLLYTRRINISADEDVVIKDEIYRADLDEMHVFTDKVIKERDEGKEEAETRLAELIGDYNEQMITSNENMTAYCKLHKLNPREADCEEVFKLVYPCERLEIINGTMRPFLFGFDRGKADASRGKTILQNPREADCTEPIVEYPSLSELPFYRSMVSNIRNTGTNTATYTTSSNISVR